MKAGQSVHPSYQDEPLDDGWYERLVALHESIWGLSAAEVEQRITRIPLLEMLVIHQPGGHWEARLPQIQLNFSGQGSTPQEAIDSLVKLLGQSSEHIESHPLLRIRPTTGAVEYLEASLPDQLRPRDTHDTVE